MTSDETPPIPHPFAPRGHQRGGARTRPVAALLSAPLLLVLATGAWAETQRVDVSPRVDVLPAPPPPLPKAAPPSTDGQAARPRLPRDKRSQVEGLFAALKVAPDERSAKMIADRLDQIFTDSGSPSVDLLMARANAALEARDYDLALQMLDKVIEIEPDYIGALSRRATILYMRDDYGSALVDMREVLLREPRHYAMLYGLALIFREFGDDKRALDAVRRARAVNPRLDGAEDMERQLAIKVEGREI